MSLFKSIIFSLVAVLILANLAMGNGFEKYAFYEASAKYKLPVELLMALSYVESRHKTDAINTETYNGSVDRCHMQVNSFWKKKLPAGGWNKLQSDPRYCTHVGAWVMRGNVNTYGMGWDAVCAYHTGKSLKQLKKRAQTGKKEHVERYVRAVNYVRSVWAAMKHYKKVLKEERGKRVAQGSVYSGKNDQPLR